MVSSSWYKSIIDFLTIYNIITNQAFLLFLIELLKTITICILRLTHKHKYIFVEGSAFEQSYKSSDGRLLWKVCRSLFIACCQIQSGKIVTHGLSSQSVTHYFEVYERSATDAYLWILCDYIESGMYLEASDQHNTT